MPEKKPAKTSAPRRGKDPTGTDKLILDKLYEVRCSLRDLQGTVTQSALNQSFRALATMIWEFREHTKYGEGRLRSNAAIGRSIEDLILDHVFPIAEAADELFTRDMDRENFEHFMRTRLVACLITREEHKRLEDMKLKQSMPKAWDRKDVFSRYAEAGIELPERS